MSCIRSYFAVVFLQTISRKYFSLLSHIRKQLEIFIIVCPKEVEICISKIMMKDIKGAFVEK